ncbi:YceI family protein [Spiractinospora alimapuensis]|uniref:YceI family protein n=1 Tax=Spiractinospora alimapuensis TaxID=2820884 RepID=UPI001F415C1C|nr:YceI family protein [Spiractinospora alimapuensis]QVQ50673.1 YceI family protein [Spiractinospora alimapuensis]
MTSNVPGDGDQPPLTPGVWHLDPLHSSIIFVAKYLRYGRVQGTIGQARGVVVVGSELAESSVEVVLRAASVNTGVGPRDDHLRSADFLDVETHPELRFVSTAIEPGRRGTESFVLRGDLSLHGVTREVALSGAWVGESPDYIHPDTIFGHFLTATTRIRLSDFGVGDGGPGPLGVRMVGDEIDIVLEVRLQDADPAEFLREIGALEGWEPSLQVDEDRGVV